MCPACSGDNVSVHEYDFGICPQTGYHDAGEGFKCHDCGAEGDADDLVPSEDEDSNEAKTGESAIVVERAKRRPRHTPSVSHAGRGHQDDRASQAVRREPPRVSEPCTSRSVGSFPAQAGGG